ncbi:hypothetical protein TM01_09095 [Campylobacter jejuni subsp. jejuni]|nr:hypothetical protein TM01_09095 [Campylobacter jejuni subsp. jejuni]
MAEPPTHLGHMGLIFWDPRCGLKRPDVGHDRTAQLQGHGSVACGAFSKNRDAQGLLWAH